MWQSYTHSSRFPPSPHLLHDGSQQLGEQTELSRVQQGICVQLVGAESGVLLTETVQLKVRHHLHVLLDQGRVRVKVARLLEGGDKRKTFYI